MDSGLFVALCILLSSLTFGKRYCFSKFAWTIFGFYGSNSRKLNFFISLLTPLLWPSSPSQSAESIKCYKCTYANGTENDGRVSDGDCSPDNFNFKQKTQVCTDACLYKRESKYLIFAVDLPVEVCVCAQANNLFRLRNQSTGTMKWFYSRHVRQRW